MSLPAGSSYSDSAKISTRRLERIIGDMLSGYGWDFRPTYHYRWEEVKLWRDADDLELHIEIALSSITYELYMIHVNALLKDTLITTNKTSLH